MAFFQKQPMMRKVLYSLAPIYAFSIYAYGIRVILLSIFVFAAGIFTEYLFEKRKKKPVSEAVLVSCALYTLSMPPNVPIWVAVIGIVFGIVFGKEVYGGFGRNVFNPAITGRLFVYISFPLFLTAGWISPSFFGTDAVASATPLDLMRQGESVNLLNLFFGWRAGTLGEAPIFLILAAAVYLVVTKTASWRIMVSTFSSAAILTFLLDLFKVPKALPTLSALLSGSLLFVIVFMATDPISAPKKLKSHWYYGIIIGGGAVLIRTFSLFSEGVSFAVLVGNTFASLIDEVVVEKKKVAPKKVVTANEQGK